jgi:hypothetical protein
MKLIMILVLCVFGACAADPPTVHLDESGPGVTSRALSSTSIDDAIGEALDGTSSKAEDDPDMRIECIEDLNMCCFFFATSDSGSAIGTDPNAGCCIRCRPDGTCYQFCGPPWGTGSEQF